MGRIFKRGGMWWPDYTSVRGERVREAASTELTVAKATLGEAIKAVEQRRGGLTLADPALHSFRHSLATMLAASSVPMALAQRVMWHSDIRLAAGTFTDECLLPLGEAMKSLAALVEPSARAVRMAATGTDQAVPDSVPNPGHNVAEPGISLRPASSPEPSQVHDPAVLGTIGLNTKQCGRQESNLHSLAATGS